MVFAENRPTIVGHDKDQWASRLRYERVVHPRHSPPSALRRHKSLNEPMRDLAAYNHVHHAVGARVCIERARYWQAEYWISGVRDNALTLACRRLGLSAYYGRGFDDLPVEIRHMVADALVRSLDRVELLRALGRAVEALLRQSTEAG